MHMQVILVLKYVNHIYLKFCVTFVLYKCFDLSLI